MDYEKAYKQALERARKLYNEAMANDYVSDMEDYEQIFPELKESKDEKVRKAILKLVKQSVLLNSMVQKSMISWLERQGERKPTEWSEHQHKLLNYAISMTDDTEVKCFLESLRNTGSNTGWSEEDEMMLECVLGKISDLGTGEMCKDWLKSIKDRVQPQSKQDWSEEDSAMMNLLIEELNSIAKHNGCLKQYEPEINWLKSLKPNHWKPSKEQMEALEDAISCRALPWEQLGTLYNDLKKL